MHILLIHINIINRWTYLVNSLFPRPSKHSCYIFLCIIRKPIIINTGYFSTSWTNIIFSCLDMAEILKKSLQLKTTHKAASTCTASCAMLVTWVWKTGFGKLLGVRIAIKMRSRATWANFFFVSPFCEKTMFSGFLLVDDLFSLS